MSTPENYKIIGIQLTYDMAENVTAAIEQFDPAILQEHTLNDGKELACRVHLGYVASNDQIRTIIVRSVDWAVNYFLAGDVREIRGGWFRPLSLGMFLSLLTRNDESLRVLASWAKPSNKPEYKGPLQDEIQLLYLVLSSLFQEKATKGFDKLRAKIAACRTKEVRLLRKAFDAVSDCNQDDFDGAIKACVMHHKTKPRPEPDAYFMEDWLPLHANTLYLAGLNLGLKPPEYPDDIAAYLMTPESVGFGT